ncbi:uncharacterized protein traf3ip2a [Hippocampus zosterae]|uniref:uncharacterized protein traf3ip2a n=1 Tax=Hippocampus zosterae TaxID=109293 RepID=UPI00223E60F9|nr:uncharacterized protein traf3ip2a [Hippocampus zosterae]
MDTWKSLCSHRSVPIEVDEGTPPSGLSFDWAPDCQRRSGPGNSASREPSGEMSIHTKRDRLLQRYFQSELKTTSPPACARGAWLWLPRPGESRRCDFSQAQNELQCSLDEEDGLEPPLTLRSEVNSTYDIPSHDPAAHIQGQSKCSEDTMDVVSQFVAGLRPKPESCCRRCACQCQRAAPLAPPWNHPGNKTQYGNVPNVTNALQRAQAGAAPGAVVCEVGFNDPLRVDFGPGTRETRRTVTLPDEYRNVFITYSVDTAEQMTALSKFLTSQGFKPAIDIFDNPTIRMGITRWMDRFLNDKSVLIIVAISPKYKEDVEGDADDEHGLHTKYIHNRIQNEFIQQGCLNFRLIPVLFCNATKKHVPGWLQNTRIYRWPRDTQDLLLRLLREERYIVPQPEASLTLTIRPL